jgi:hypothetical protein
LAFASSGPIGPDDAKAKRKVQKIQRPKEKDQMIQRPKEKDR